MRQATRSRGGLPALLAGAAALAIGACGGGGGSPTSPPPPGANPGFASFRLAGAGYDQVVSYAGGANLVFCRRQAGWAHLWIRFAQQAAGDGESGPHLDLDLCNHGDGGTFAAMDPHAASCGQGRTWDIWWHGEGDTFVNGAASRSCSLTLTRHGERLSGTFACLGLAEFGGARTLDVLDGSFQCSEQ